MFARGNAVGVLLLLRTASHSAASSIAGQAQAVGTGPAATLPAAPASTTAPAAPQPVATAGAVAGSSAPDVYALLTEQVGGSPRLPDHWLVGA